MKETLKRILPQANEGFTASAVNHANYLFVKVTYGVLKLGMKKSEQIGNDWTCFNNFRLFAVSGNASANRELPKRTLLFCSQC